MRYGRMESLMRSVAKLMPQLQGRSDGVILIIGDHTEHIPANSNTVVWNDQYCKQRAQNLPANTVVILTNGCHSHSATNNIRAICQKQKLDMPMYTLTAGCLNELLKILLRHMCPSRYAAAKPVEQQPSRQLRTAPTPTPKLQDKHLQMLSYGQAVKLFEDFFSRKQVLRLSNMELMLEFAVVLEVGSYNLSHANFCNLLRHYRKLTETPKRRCDRGNRRNRQGSPKRQRLTPRVSTSW